MALGFLRKLLMSTGHEELQPEDARLAIASVLVMAARADGKYDYHEASIIDRALARRFSLSADLARGLREQGEEAEGAAIDIYQFTKAIRTAIPHEQREAILEELWGVVLSDGVRDPHEDTLMRQIVDRLGLSPMDSALARQKVQGGGSAPGM